MFSKLISRLFGKTDPAEEDLNSRKPIAGEQRIHGPIAALYLAPLPVETSQQAASLHDFGEVNDVYLQMGATNKGMVLQGKMLAFVIWNGLLAMFGFPIIITSVSLLMHPSHYREFFSSVANGTEALFFIMAPCVVFLISVFIGVMISGVRTLTKLYPIRFNRQRREVCYINSKTQQPLIIPWESVVAWIGAAPTVVGQSVTTEHSFGLAFEDTATGMVYRYTTQHFTQPHAIGQWEAIRRYMEQGISKQTGTDWVAMTLSREITDEEWFTHEGLHTWNVERLAKMDIGALHSHFTDEELIEFGSTPRSRWPLRWWYVRRVLTFWKMPYLIAEWGHRAGTPAIPESVLEWSKPIPEDQWAKPSAELINANKIVREAMARELDFVSACKLLEGPR